MDILDDAPRKGCEDTVLFLAPTGAGLEKQLLGPLLNGKLSSNGVPCPLGPYKDWSGNRHRSQPVGDSWTERDAARHDDCSPFHPAKNARSRGCVDRESGCRNETTAPDTDKQEQSGYQTVAGNKSDSGDAECRDGYYPNQPNQPRTAANDPTFPLRAAEHPGFRGG